MLPAILVLTGKGCLGMDPHFGSGPIDKAGNVGGSKAVICNPELVEPHLGMERMWQHSHGTVPPAIHVLTGHERLEMGPHFDSGQI